MYIHIYIELVEVVDGGRKGVGINFITKRDIKNLKAIEQHYSTQIEELPSSFVNK